MRQGQINLNIDKFHFNFFKLNITLKTYIINLIIFCCIILFVPADIFAQIIKIRDKSDLQPVISANIYPADRTKPGLATTNDKGEADITALPANDSLIISHVAYQEIRTTKTALAAAGNKVFLAENAVRMNEIVFSANRKEESKEDIPTKIEIITSKQIAFANPQSTADMLAQSGKVFVQQSQMGGGSPVLRGFEANKVLMVVDGVRMNNAIYRGGHLQNAITVDPNLLERTEVIFGPGSVIYGSDALGGVMHFFSKQPKVSLSGKPEIGGTAFTRYATVNQEKTGHLDINLGFKKLAFLSSFTYKDLGDLRTGHIRNPFYGDFGKRTFYVERIDGKDSVIKNNEYNLQKQSGYKQYDFMQKVLFQATENSRYTLNFQYSTSSDIPRYDRLTDVRNGNPRFAEWYYGPQERILGSARADYKRTSGIFDNASFIAAYQNIKESRINRAYRKNEREHQEENVDVYSFNMDFSKQIGKKNELRYGAEANYNNVGSKAFVKNIETAETAAFQTRYPGGGSSMQTIAAYVTHNWEISPKLIFTQGVRYSNIILKADFSDTTFYKSPFLNVNQNNNAVNGNLGLVYAPDNQWKFSAMLSSGFRAPNVDDLAKVFESATGSLVIPNPDINPETVYNGELGITKRFGEKIQIEGVGFYSQFKDAIVLRPTTLNGSDSVMYNGVKSAVISNQNASEAYIYGFQGDLSAQITQAFSISSAFTYTYGRVTTDKTPLDHIPPVYGQTSFKLEIRKFKGEFFVRYNGWKHLSDYSTSSTEDNLRYATNFGMPAWNTLNLRTDYQITQNLKIQAGLENILDMHYRVFASGISAPGRNFYAALRANF